MPNQDFRANHKIWLIQEPNSKQAYHLLKKALQQKRLIQIIGRCHVEYEGRARSILTEGERLIILKRDGAILVHQENGVEPVNWQPPGASLKVSLKETNLSIYATRVVPRETVHIDFSKIAMISASLIEDTGLFSMHLTEDEMQQVLSANPGLIEPGLRTISRERQIAPGFIDIFARDSQERLVIIEVKRKRADNESVLQLHNYIKSFKGDETTQPRGILVAPSLTKGTHALLQKLALEYKKITPQQCAPYLQKRQSHMLTDFLSATQNNETN